MPSFPLTGTLSLFALGFREGDFLLSLDGDTRLIGSAGGSP